MNHFELVWRPDKWALNSPHALMKARGLDTLIELVNMILKDQVLLLTLGPKS
jgi:hypothetical protein